MGRQIKIGTVAGAKTPVYMQVDLQTMGGFEAVPAVRIP